MEEELEAGDLKVVREKPFLESRFFTVLMAIMRFGMYLLLAFTIADGFWYLTVASNSLARYSAIADSGRTMLFIGIFLYFYLKGDLYHVQ